MKNEEEEKEEEDLRKMTYLHGGALVESFSPQGRHAPLLFSVRLRERASPRPRQGAMAVLHLRLGAPKVRLSQLWAYQSKGEYIIMSS